MECVIKIGHSTIDITVIFGAVAEFNRKQKKKTSFNLVICCNFLSVNVEIQGRV
jgi:hypothetical protein